VFAVAEEEDDDLHEGVVGIGALDEGLVIVGDVLGDDDGRGGGGT